MNKITSIEITFPVPVELPDGWERALDALVGIVCGFYEREHPDRVMWPAGCGAKPEWHEPDEPTFDTSVFSIQVSEREDYYGNNEYNPDGERLRRERAEQRKAAKEGR